ncbi:hypothetical protein [Actinokineospora cianjurensis]|uniref:SaeA second Fn3-like domain-containing protein n=1 Tax=Actinokineospora cianjurensis TaxID=585224 RepID=A0A421AVT2_9PSEU|nr:hypothetical protein [Actinokineospora cianjurensis]RLK54189.1 hypothetical protein CLV68_6192 [Actinokineospora cianjurensis]
MADWKLDEALLIEEVIGPVGGGWSPLRDLFRVYQLPREVSDQQVIDAALAGVLKALSRSKISKFGAACTRVRTCHPDAEKVLRDHKARAAHRADLVKQDTRLAESLRHQLNGAPGLIPADVVKLVRESSGRLTRSRVRAVLATVQAAEREPAVDLSGPPPQWTKTKAHLATIGRADLLTYLTETEGLSGQRTTLDLVEKRRQGLRVHRDPASTAETSLLVAIRGWLGTPDGLVAALRHEVFDELRKEKAYGYAELRKAVSAAAKRLRTLGVTDSVDDIAYAVWCGGAGATAEAALTWESQYTEAVGEHRLRDALAVLSNQPNLPDQWRRRQNELAATLTNYDEELTRAAAAEQVSREDAAAIYARIGRDLSDPLVDAGLLRCPPAAPRAVETSADGEQVVISWESSSSTAGLVTYQVHRGAGVVADSVIATTYVDARAPAGEELTYRVTTLREGVPGGSASGKPVFLTRDVVRPTATSRSDAVTIDWELPERALAVRVTRTDDEGGVAPTRVTDVAKTGFTDRSVRQGTTYTYRLQVEYRSGGGEVRMSKGTHVTVACQRVPVGVTDLRVDFDADGLTAAWTPPPHGEVELRVLPPEATAPTQQVVELGAARAVGELLKSAGHRTAGSLRARAAQASGYRVIVAITVLGELAAFGTAVEVDSRATTIGALAANRRGSAVHLRWEWPDGATAAKVVWRRDKRPVSADEPGLSTMDLTRAAYESAGGVTVHTGQGGDYWFGVCTATAHRGTTVLGPMTALHETVVGEARYSVRRAGLLSRKRVFAVVGTTELPVVVLMAKSGTKPTGAADGEEIARTPAGDLTAQTTFDIPVHLRRPVHLRAFPVPSQLRLIPTDVAKLVID